MMSRAKGTEPKGQDGNDLCYLSPQALSNQKLGEMRRRFGQGRCGLQTGDTSLK